MLTKSIKKAVRFSIVAGLFYITLATLTKAEVSFSEANRANTPPPGEPSFFPVSNCRRIEEGDILKVGSHLLARQVREKLRSSLSDYSDYPDLISLDDCGDFFVVSSVLGLTTVGERIRMIFPKTDSSISGEIDEASVLIFYSR